MSDEPKPDAAFLDEQKDTSDDWYTQNRGRRGSVKGRWSQFEKGGGSQALPVATKQYRTRSRPTSSSSASNVTRSASTYDPNHTLTPQSKSQNNVAVPAKPLTPCSNETPITGSVSNKSLPKESDARVLAKPKPPVTPSTVTSQYQGMSTIQSNSDQSIGTGMVPGVQQTVLVHQSVATSEIVEAKTVKDDSKHKHSDTNTTTCPPNTTIKSIITGNGTNSTLIDRSTNVPTKQVAESSSTPRSEPIDDKSNSVCPDASQSQELTIPVQKTENNDGKVKEIKPANTDMKSETRAELQTLEVSAKKSNDLMNNHLVGQTKVTPNMPMNTETPSASKSRSKVELKKPELLPKITDPVVLRLVSGRPNTNRGRPHSVHMAGNVQFATGNVLSKSKFKKETTSDTEKATKLDQETSIAGLQGEAVLRKNQQPEGLTKVIQATNEMDKPNLEAEVAKLQGELKQKLRKLAEKQGAIEKLKSVETDHKGQIASFEFEMKKKQEELAEKQATIDKLQSDKLEQEAQIASLLEEVKNESNVLTKNRADMIEKLQADLDNTTAELSTALGEKQYFQQQCDEIRVGYQSTIEDLRQALDAKVTEVETLKHEVGIHEMTAKQYQEDFEAERKDREAAAGRRIEEVGRLQSAIQKLREDRLHDQLAFQQRQRDLEMENRRLIQENDSQRRRLDSMNSAADLDELASFRLDFQDPLPASRKVGSGCYGTVYAIEVDGVQCIAKRVQDILLGEGGQEDVGGQQRRAIQQKFRQECILLSKIRHPNIVQFMGVRYGRDMYDLTLVMERLPMDLQKCLEKCQANGFFIPLSIRFSILLDVTYGLLHLHNRPEPILHRDLSAGNILLTSNLRAKIADLGVSRIVSEQIWSQKLSVLPGSIAYMPPEALKDNPDYNLKLDVFSFGVLALFVALQEFPKFSWDHIPDEIARKGERELYKRKQWISKIGNQHFLYPLIHRCLQDNSDARPSTAELNTMMRELSKKYPHRLQDINVMFTELSKLGMCDIVLAN